MSFVVIKDQTNAYSEDFSSCDYKGYNMLFESPNHAVNNEVSAADKQT